MNTMNALSDPSDFDARVERATVALRQTIFLADYGQQVVVTLIAAGVPDLLAEAEQASGLRRRAERAEAEHEKLRLAAIKLVAALDHSAQGGSQALDELREVLSATTAI